MIYDALYWMYDLLVLGYMRDRLAAPMTDEGGLTV